MSGSIVVSVLDALYVKTHRPFTIVETGTLRDAEPEPNYLSEERSTLAIAQWIESTGDPHVLHSIDLSEEHIVRSKAVLAAHKLEHLVQFHQGHSDDVLNTLKFPVDFAFLDSDTDPLVILSEYSIVKQRMREPGIILIDDVFKENIGVNKGRLALPVAANEGRKYWGIRKQVAGIAFGDIAEQVLESQSHMDWNGQRAAVSLTFDDGLPVQIEHAIPELDARDIKGTFFVIQNSMYDTEFRRDTWLAAIANGHEIGSHSVNHRKPSEISVEESRRDVIDSKRFLQDKLGTDIVSYAYPYTHVTDANLAAARKTYLQARGGRAARADRYIVQGDGVNMHNTPCLHVGPGALHEVPGWIETALERGAWLTLMFHGIGPDESNWDNISTPDFIHILDMLNVARQRGLWVAPYGVVAKSLRFQNARKNG